MDAKKIKEQFPIFKFRPELIYLDNAATTQKPASVLQAMNDFYMKTNSNVHRSEYGLAEEATALYENARYTIARHINVDNVIFTSGGTESLNVIANSIGFKKVYVDKYAHFSNLHPWINRVDDVIDAEYISVDKVQRLGGKKNILDATQAVAHMIIPVQDYEFIAFSGHKMYGPTGIGVLWAKDIKQVNHFKKGAGDGFELGTPPIAEAIGLAAACKFMQEIGGYDYIIHHDKQLTTYLVDRLQAKVINKQNGIIKFNVEGYLPQEVATAFAKSNICVRAGSHCSYEPDSVRISFGVYNTKDDIDAVLDVVDALNKGEYTFA